MPMGSPTLAENAVGSIQKSCAARPVAATLTNSVASSAWNRRVMKGSFKMTMNDGEPAMQRRSGGQETCVFSPDLLASCVPPLRGAVRRSSERCFQVREFPVEVRRIDECAVCERQEA